MEETIDINNLQYVQNRQHLLNLSDEQLSIRRPSTERQQKDRSVLLLSKYRSLQEALATARAKIWENVDIGDVDANGIITLKAFDTGKFSVIQKNIHDYLLQINNVEIALKKLAALNAPFDHELLKSINTMDHNVRAIDSELNRLKNSTRLQENQPKIKQLQQEKAKLEKELAKVRGIKEQVDSLFDGVDFSSACSAAQN